MTTPELDDFSCAICLETLHKPAVNHCGHAFCFWCFHHAMSGLGASHCPLCRASFKHFAGVCQPLHTYLQVQHKAATYERSHHTSYLHWSLEAVL